MIDMVCVNGVLFNEIVLELLILLFLFLFCDVVYFCKVMYGLVG